MEGRAWPRVSHGGPRDRAPRVTVALDSNPAAAGGARGPSRGLPRGRWIHESRAVGARSWVGGRDRSARGVLDRHRAGPPSRALRVLGIPIDYRCVPAPPAHPGQERGALGTGVRDNRPLIGTIHLAALAWRTDHRRDPFRLGVAPTTRDRGDRDPRSNHRAQEKSQLSSAFTASYVFLWVLVAFLFLLVLLLYRQYGLTSLASRTVIALQGLDVGSKAPRFLLWQTDQPPRAVEPAVTDGLAGRLIVFSQPTCEVCSRLAGQMAGLPAAWPDVEFLWITGANPPTVAVANPSGQTPQPSEWLVGGAPDSQVHREWGVSSVPFAFVCDRSGRIVGKNLVNTRRDVESLLTALGGKPPPASRPAVASTTGVD